MAALSFCERSGASIYSKVHIRTVGPEGRLPGGGIPTPAMCGYDLRGGWDIDGDVTEKSIRDGVEDQTAIGAVCDVCAEISHRKVEEA